VRKFNAIEPTPFINQMEGKIRTLQKAVDNIRHIDNIFIVYTVDNETETDKDGILVRWNHYFSVDNMIDLAKFKVKMLDEIKHKEDVLKLNNAIDELEIQALEESLIEEEEE